MWSHEGRNVGVGATWHGAGGDGIRKMLAKKKHDIVFTEAGGDSVRLVLWSQVKNSKIICSL